MFYALLYIFFLFLPMPLTANKSGAGAPTPVSAGPLTPMQAGPMTVPPSTTTPPASTQIPLPAPTSITSPVPTVSPAPTTIIPTPIPTITPANIPAPTPIPAPTEMPAPTPAPTTSATPTIVSSPAVDTPAPNEKLKKEKSITLTSIYIKNVSKNDCQLEEVELEITDKDAKSRPFIKKNLKISLPGIENIYNKGSIVGFDITTKDQSVQAFNKIVSITVSGTKIELGNVTHGLSVNTPIVITKENKAWVVLK